MKNINIGKKETIHFIGIGGIGMSGLAQIMKIMGFNVQGSDLSQNKNSDNCKKIGIKIGVETGSVLNKYIGKKSDKNQNSNKKSNSKKAQKN